MSLFRDKALMITGGTGSFGNAVLNRFLQTDIGEIRIFSRDEKKQDDMRHEFQAKMPEVADKIKFYIGDVRNLESCRGVMHGVDYIFHAAALKQVPSCEFFPMEAVRTNIIGTDNVLTAAIEAGVESVICLSTDKAAYPINAMGITKAKIMASDILHRLGLEKDGYILLSAHREENIDTDKNFTSLFNAINSLAEKYDMPILYSCHPRSKKKLEASGFKLDPRVRVNEPLGFNDYNCLQMNALAIVSDSGTLPEESSFYLSIGHPIAAVCIRTSTERPEAMEAGDFILAGISTNELLQATDMAIKMKRDGVLGKPCPDYVDETVSMKVVRIIQGYVNVVNKMVWRKDR